MADIFGVRLPNWGGALGKIVAALVALVKALKNSASEDERIEIRHAADGSLHISLVGEYEDGSSSGGDESGSGGDESGSGSGGGDESGSGGFVDLKLSHEMSGSGLLIKLTGSVFGCPVDTHTTVPVSQCDDASGS